MVFPDKSTCNLTRYGTIRYIVTRQDGKAGKDYSFAIAHDMPCIIFKMNYHDFLKCSDYDIVTRDAA